MDTLEDLLGEIPRFLRRPEDSTARPVILPAPDACVRREPRLPRGRPIHGGRAPATPPFGAQPPAPKADAAPSASPRDTAGQAGAEPKVVALAPRGEAAPALVPALPEPIALRAEVEAAARDWPRDEDNSDVAFQVTLPRSVIRQIRLCAAAEGTTHRAIILRALRAAGLAVPKGADVDRRALAARRRQQA